MAENIWEKLFPKFIFVGTTIDSKGCGLSETVRALRLPVDKDNNLIAIPTFNFQLSDTQAVSSFARTNWYDRNPLTVVKTFGTPLGGIAPHAVTERWVYTVPTGRKAYVESASVISMRDAAAAPAGAVTDYIVYNTAPSTQLALIQYLNNTVGHSMSMGIGQSVTMLEGDTLKGYTTDASTGGTCTHFINAKLTEFAA